MATAAREEIVRVEIPYCPRPLQEEIHKSLKRWSILVCHRRFGKTVLSINQLIKHALTCKLPKPRCAYIAPLRNQAKQIAWDYLRYYASVVPGTMFNESELRADFGNGARITLYGCDNPDALRGIYLDMAVLDEPAQMHPRVAGEILRPALADRGGSALWIGTPMGHNAFYTTWQSALADPEWYTAMYRASETNILPKAELEAARRQMSDEQYRQEFECSFEAAILGAYYGTLLEQAEREKRITNVPYDPTLPVDCCWDIGVDDMTVIWMIQGVPGGEVHVIDLIEGSGKGVEDYLTELGKLPYRWGVDYVPHDMEARSFVAGNRSPADIARSHRRTLHVIEKMNPLERIQATRLLLPRMWFDKTRCANGIEALKQYRKIYNDRRQTYEEHPYHDWTSHFADSLGHYAVGYRGPRHTSQPSEYLPQYLGEA